MGWTFETSSPDFKDKQSVASIIPLHFGGCTGDSRLRVMLLTSILKNPLRLGILFTILGWGLSTAEETGDKQKAVDKAVAPEVVQKPEEKPKLPEKIDPSKGVEEKPEIDPDDEVAVEEAEAHAAAVARPVSPDPIQVYGWREKIMLDGMDKAIIAKLDTGAYTSSIHAEEKELFERDGKKWVRFIVTEPRRKGSPRVRLEAPLVRIARIKEPGGVSESREVVRLAFKIGERKLRGDFTLNNRSNMLSAILIGRTTIKELGWIDPSRTNLAKDKIMR